MRDCVVDQPNLRVTHKYLSSIFGDNLLNVDEGSFFPLLSIHSMHIVRVAYELKIGIYILQVSKLFYLLS